MNKHKSRKTLIFVLSIIIALVAAGYFLFQKNNNVKPARTTNTRIAANTENKNITTTTAPAPNPRPNPDSNVPGGSTGSEVSSSSQLTSPTGSFVSNHGSADKPVSTQTNELSSCTTTPGASCDIKFSKGNITKNLGPKITSTSSGNLPAGTVTWQWTPASVGLTQGEWNIMAEASLNGQNKSAPDQIKLSIQ